jgi:hypothetical protein
MGRYDRQHALQNLAGRAHHHPTLGKHFFDVGTISRHLQWVEWKDVQFGPQTVGDKDAATEVAKTRADNP